MIGVMEFGAVWSDTASQPKEEFRSSQHAESWGEEIHPKRVPVAASKCRTKGSGGIHTHSGERGFECNENRVKRADKIWGVAEEQVVIGRKQNGEHQGKGGVPRKEREGRTFNLSRWWKMHREGSLRTVTFGDGIAVDVRQ